MVMFGCWHLPLVLWLPSVLWRCWLGDRKGIRPVKTEWWGAGMVNCMERGADLHMTQLMPLPPTVSCFSKMQIGITFLVPAHPGSPGQRAIKRARVRACVRVVCVCVCVCVCVRACVRAFVCLFVWLVGWLVGCSLADKLHSCVYILLLLV